MAFKNRDLTRATGYAAMCTSFALTLLSAGLFGGFLVAFGQLISQALQGVNLSGQIWLLVVLALGTGVSEAVRIGIEQASIKAEGDALQTKLLDFAFRRGPASLKLERGGALVDMMTSGVEKIENYRQGYFGAMIGGMCVPVLTLAIMAIAVDPLSALILLCFIPIIPLLVVAFRKITQRVSGKSRRARNALAAAYLEAINGLETLTLLGAADRRADDLAQAGEKNRRATMQVLSANQLILFIIDAGFNLLLITVAFGLAMWRLQTGYFGFDVSALGKVVGLMGLAFLLLEPMGQIGGFFYVGMGGMANQRRVRGFIQKAGPAVHPVAKDNVVADGDAEKYAIYLEGVTFGYSKDRSPVLTDLSLRVKPGTHLVICGPSGEGKSTLAQILKGDLLPSAGRVAVGGMNLVVGNQRAVRSRSALVQQTTWAFTGTIRSNLTMVAPLVKDEEIWAALNRVHLEEEVRGFPQGIDTPLGEGGLGLSGGQLQRLSLARALLSGRKLLILDEPTSQIDLDSEAAILSVIDDLGPEITVVMITHRRSSLRGADRVLQMRKGRLVTAEEAEQNDEDEAAGDPTKSADSDPVRGAEPGQTNGTEAETDAGVKPEVEAAVIATDQIAERKEDTE